MSTGVVIRKVLIGFAMEAEAMPLISHLGLVKDTPKR